MVSRFTATLAPYADGENLLVIIGLECPSACELSQVTRSENKVVLNMHFSLSLGPLTLFWSLRSVANGSIDIFE